MRHAGAYSDDAQVDVLTVFRGAEHRPHGFINIELREIG